MRVASTQALHRVTCCTVTADDDRAHRFPERGRHRRLGSRLDLEVVDQRAHHPVDALELVGRGIGTGHPQLGLERVGAGAGAGCVTFCPTPTFFCRVHRGLRDLDREHGVGPGEREPFGLRVEQRELVAKCTRIGDQRLDHTFVGRSVELALEPAPLLVEECPEATTALTERFDAHHPVGETFVAERGE